MKRTLEMMVEASEGEEFGELRSLLQRPDSTTMSKLAAILSGWMGDHHADEKWDRYRAYIINLVRKWPASYRKLPLSYVASAALSHDVEPPLGVKWLVDTADEMDLTLDLESGPDAELAHLKLLDSILSLRGDREAGLKPFSMNLDARSLTYLLETDIVKRTNITKLTVINARFSPVNDGSKDAKALQKFIPHLEELTWITAPLNAPLDGGPLVQIAEGDWFKMGRLKRLKLTAYFADPIYFEDLIEDLYSKNHNFEEVILEIPEGGLSLSQVQAILFNVPRRTTPVVSQNIFAVRR
jgi:hypothetical protein